MPWFYYVIMGLTMLFGSPSNLPLGLPPLPEDPLLSKVAPEECLWYMSWSGTAKPDAKSTNQTEQLLAERDVRRFVQALRLMAIDGAKQGAGDNPQTKLLAGELPGLLTTLLTRPTAIFYEKNIPDGQGGQQPVGGAIVNLGDQAAAVAKSLARLEAAFLGGAAPVEIAGRKWHAAPLPGTPIPALWSIRGNYLIVGLGKTSVEGILRRTKTDPPTWLTDLKKRLPVERISLVNYYNVGALRKTVPADYDPKMQAILAAVGIDQLKTMASVSGLDKQGFVGRTSYTLDGEPRGMFALAAGKPLSPADLAGIPRDVTLAAAGRFDVAKTMAQALHVVGQTDKNTLAGANEAIATADKVLGINLKEHLAGLGDVWRVWSGGEGGMLTVSVDVRDRKRVAALLAKLEAQMVRKVEVRFAAPVPIKGRTIEEGGLRVEPRTRIRVLPMTRKFTFKGQTITFLNKTPTRFMPVAPAWCLTEKELLISLFPQGIKAYLSRPSGAPSLIDEPKVAAALRGGRTIGFSYLDTKGVATQLYPLLQIMAQVGASQLQREGLAIDMSSFPAASAILPHLSSTVSSLERTEEGFMTVTRATLPGSGAAVTTPAAAIAMLLPAVQAVRAAARKNFSMNNLRNLGTAIHNYAADHRERLPTDKKKALLSWRVHLLPWMEEGNLYDQFHFDEPWDSEHNKTLIKQMPPLYFAPTSSIAREEGKTVYLAVTGKNTAFEKGAKVGLEMPDGTSATILLVEASDERAVIWTKPDDWEFNPDKPLDGLMGQRPGGFLALFADTAVRQISPNVDKENFRRMILRNDRQLVDLNDLGR